MFEKTSQSKVKEIMDLGKQGVPVEEITKKTGVSGPTVRKYLRKFEKEERGDNFNKLIERLDRFLEAQNFPEMQRCPICRGILYPHFPQEDDYIWWLCPKCGYKGQSPEPEWKKLEEYKIY